LPLATYLTALDNLAYGKAKDDQDGEANTPWPDWSSFRLAGSNQFIFASVG
jgi:hypothetical protein